MPSEHLTIRIPFVAPFSGFHLLGLEVIAEWSLQIAISCGSVAAGWSVQGPIQANDDHSHNVLQDDAENREIIYADAGCCRVEYFRQCSRDLLEREHLCVA